MDGCMYVCICVCAILAPSKLLNMCFCQFWNVEIMVTVLLKYLPGVLRLVSTEDLGIRREGLRASTVGQ